jgi:hypothetical protein
MPVITFNRLTRDAELTANHAMPNANATTFSAFIDLGQANAHPINETSVLCANVPAIPNLANTVAITFTVEDADANANANAATLSTLGTQTVTGGTSGGAATELNWKLPGTARRFIRIKAVGGANAGTTITQTATAELRT